MKKTPSATHGRTSGSKDCGKEVKLRRSAAAEHLSSCCCDAGIPPGIASSVLVTTAGITCVPQPAHCSCSRFSGNTWTFRSVGVISDVKEG